MNAVEASKPKIKVQARPEKSGSGAMGQAPKAVVAAGIPVDAGTTPAFHYPTNRDRRNLQRPEVALVCSVLPHARSRQPGPQNASEDR